jgi:NADPH:quinone reductase-like Zn-dependent oxidoreductase
LPAIPSYEFSGVVVDGTDVKVGEEVYALSGFDRDGGPPTTRSFRPAISPPSRERSAMSKAPPSRSPGSAPGRDCSTTATCGRGSVCSSTERRAASAISPHRHGAHVVTTASTADSGTVGELGADEVADHTRARFDEVVDKVDLVFDTAGGERLRRSPAVLRRGGRLVSIAEEPPADTEIATDYFVVEPNREQLVALAELVDGGEIRPAIDAVFPLAEARAAFERSMERGKRGKVVLRVAEERP